MKDGKMFCSNCGAPLKPKTDRCEYCGAFIKREDGVSIRLKLPNTNYVTELIGAETRISAPECIENRIDMGTLALKRLTHELAGKLMEKISYEQTYDPVKMQMIFRAYVEIVPPERKLKDGHQ